MTDLIGFVLPFFIDIINRKISNSKARFIVSMLVCAVVALLLNLDKLQSGDVGSLLGSIGIIFTEAQLVYKAYWEKSKIRAKLL